MRISGITFVGTRTGEGAAMARFAREVLGLQPATLDGVDATFFPMPDGTTFAVSPVGADEPHERTVGFLVDDVAAAAAELTAAGVEVDEVTTTQTQAYVHFRGPDGRLYELVESRSPSPA